MGYTRLLLLTFLVIALAGGLLGAKSRRSIRGELEYLRWAIRGDGPERLYPRAEESFEEGNFEESAALCGMLLRLNSKHAASRALLTEIEFILGQGRITPTTADYDRLMRTSLSPR
jgi:hypothetical protein